MSKLSNVLRCVIKLVDIILSPGTPEPATGGPAHGPMKLYAVACCGCQRLMVGGVAKIPFRGIVNTNMSGVDNFDTKEEADAAATAAGWKVVNGDHRCPKCKLLVDPIPSPRGMYVDLRDVDA